MNKSYRFIVLILIMVLALLSGCQNKNREVVDLSLVVNDASELAELDQYPNLQTLDLCGSDCYDAIVGYVADNPQIAVKYDVQIGDSRHPQDSKELTFSSGELDYDQLLKNLAYLPDVMQINLPQTTLSVGQLSELGSAYPDLKVTYTLMILGREVSHDVTELDLSDVEAGQIDELVPQLHKLTSLCNIQLMDANGLSKLAPTDVKKLMDAVPDAVVHYTFELFGKAISTTDETVEYVSTQIGNEGVAKVREALDILPSCTYFKLDRCGIDNLEMEKLRDDYPDVKVVWRVYFAGCNCLTDVEMVHYTDGVNNSEVQVLKYCTDIMYLDLGHNMGITDISFVSYMPKLKIAILADSSITSLEPLASCPDLERLEIVYCNNLTDLSPLANCKKLKGLNLSGAFSIRDLTPLYGLQEMERLYLGNNNIPEEQINAAIENMPNCWITRWAISHQGVSGNYAIGWRLNKDGTRADWYVEVRKIFRYDEGYSNYND